ncbi:MAG: glycoside hydrolase family 32 protein [Firmicutes bacterium]|nr:glycoside hydrolase family 32 protein [Bacillota bacterium]
MDKRISDLLKKARAYEAEAEKQIPPGDRPVYHFSPRTGWTNDPNGLSFYQGKAHLFYQYYPYETKWNSMHWGHAISSDLLHWEYLPAAMAPDESYDSFGCFSGSASELADGRQLLMYTGVHPEKTDAGIAFLQTQCMAVGDGLDYEKYQGNPVITGKDVPEGFSLTDFRDPKIFRRADGTYGCVVGNRSDDGSGALLLFESKDGFSWSFRSVLDRCRHEYGTMWECPDFFELDSHAVIITSPMEMKAKGLEFHEGAGTICLVGSLDETNMMFVRKNVQAIDHGISFYAPQTFAWPDGRRIMIGWMQSWSSCFVPEDHGWFGQMTIPRELSIREGKLIQWPVREIGKLYEKPLAFRNVRVAKEQLQLPGVRGRVMDLSVTVRPEGEGLDFFVLRFAKDDQHECAVLFDPKASTITIDRSKAGFKQDFVHVRSCDVQDRNGRIDLRILLDRYSAEIFVNGGEQALSMTFYTPQEADTITFEASGEAVMELTAYPIKDSLGGQEDE